MLRAARHAGIRITLLYTVYKCGGLREEPLTDRQRRFAAPSLEAVERALDLLAADPLVDGAMASVGIAIHSVRAVPTHWLSCIAELARQRQMALHVHASEQQMEVRECYTVTGRSPIGLLEAEGVLSPSTTLIHATHLSDEDIKAISHSGASVCLCPSTEGDLGDGVPRAADLFDAAVPLSIGSDSHVVIDPFAELRSAEFQARAATGRRCVLRDQRGNVAPWLFKKMGHENGYTALGLPMHKDFVQLDERARALQPHTSSAELLSTAFSSAHPGLVSRVCVGGQDVVVDGRHAESH